MATSKQRIAAGRGFAVCESRGQPWRAPLSTRDAPSLSLSISDNQRQRGAIRFFFVQRDKSWSSPLDIGRSSVDVMTETTAKVECAKAREQPHYFGV